MSPIPTVTASVLAFGAEAHLVACVDALLASEGVNVSVVLVDNGAPDEVVSAAASRPGVRLLRPGSNTGFTGGSRLALAEATSDHIALVNSDAIVDPHALARLCEVAARSDVGIATACVRIAADPTLVNSAGNPMTYLGLSWAGGLHEPVADHADARDVACASGAGLVMRREVWGSLVGFDPAYVAYHEDVDLSLQCWEVGLRVTYVPAALVDHHFEWSRHGHKMYLLERNRAITVLCHLQARTLLLLAPAFLLQELALLMAAAAQGWAPQKVRGWLWLIRHSGHIRRRRAAIQAQRRCDDAALKHLWEARFTPPGVPTPAALAPFNLVLAAWWRLVRRAV